MKTTLLSLFLVLLSTFISAQCTENAANFGNNTSIRSYNVSGDISVTLNTNNTITVDFASNYQTASGPDVRLYLIKSEGKSIAELKNTNPENLENISFGLVGFSGALSYTESIPENIDITKYDTVFFYCLQFNQFWDFGTYNSFTSNNCTVLDVDSFSVDKISVYPNPAKNQIQISNIDSSSAEIRIFNVLGKQVLYQRKITANSVDISNLESGIYLLNITVDSKSKTQKLVVQ
ncbi:DM13 domain-containing protein [uncultured Polaribacter sp.]|uniref:DM13 domain-containing protein n=1 Tax=uncultured Polaribacter sp. TaxID=174711 RepID=UPI00261B2DC6|nr:DM13 domain-containing protein [uncultured Polaribacter sp.]